MITPRVGWAVAVDFYGYPLGLVRTTDGGRVWRDAGPPGLAGVGLAAAFFSADDAWVTWSDPNSRAWPAIYRTADGGVSWSRLGPIPISAIGASAPDMVTGRLGWVTATLGVAAGSTAIAIFRTTNGGGHWELIERTDDIRQASGAIPFGCEKGNAVFSSATTGWVGGTCEGGGLAQFWVSRDGGRTWRHQPLPQPYGTGMLARWCQCLLTAPVFTSPRDGALWAAGLPGPPARTDRMSRS